MSRTLMIDVPGSSHRLEGRLTGEGPLALVAPPHPLYGGSIGNPVVHALEGALRARGLATLAFNFRGTGESDGEPSGDLEDARVDYLAAAAALPDAQLACLAGYSFGAIASLICAVELSVPQLVMVAPPLVLFDHALLPRYAGELFVIVGDQDDYLPAQAARDQYAERARTKLEILPGVDHYMLGGAVQDLRACLRRLLG